MTKIYKIKFLLALLFLLVANNLRASEVELFSGPFTIKSDWSTSVQLNAETFASCVTGQTIKVYFSDAAEGAQGSFKTMSDGWPGIAKDTEYFNISGDSFELAIDDDILAKLKATGLVVGGHDYIIDRIVLDSPDANTSETDIYTGPFVIASDWSTSVQLAADAFANCATGQTIKVYISSVAEGAQGSFKTMSDGWPAIAEGTEYFNISGGSFELIIDDDILAKLKATGLVVAGHDYTIDRIAIISPSSQTTEEEIYSGPFVIASDWSTSVQLAAGVFANCATGQIIKVYISSVAEGAQGSFKTMSDGWPAIAEGTEYFNISGDSFELTIDEDILAKLKATGLVVAGHDYTIDRIVMVKPASGKTEAEIYAGPTDIGNWGNIQIPATTFASCNTTQTIKVYISNVAEGAQGSFKTMSEGWPEIASGTEYFSISGESFSLAIDDDVLAKLKATGLVISGHDYTIESVVIVSPGSEKKTNPGLFPIARNEDINVADAIYDASTKTITFQKLGIAGWDWNPSYDMSMYESITIELAEKTNTSITVQISYIDKPSAEYAEIAAGKKKIEFSLNEEYSKAVESVYLYPTNEEETSIILSTVYGTLKPGRTDGIEKEILSNTDATVLSRTYYNMAGQQTSHLSKGINIIRINMSDGTSRVKKVIIK